MWFQPIRSDGYTPGPTIHAVNAIGAPAIACSAMIAASNKCLMLYGADDGGPTMRYASGRVDLISGQFVLSGEDYGSGIKIYQTPSIMTQVGDASYPFRISFKTGTMTSMALVYRKSASISSPLSFTGVIDWSPAIKAPSLGYFYTVGPSYAWAAHLVAYDN